MTIPLHRQLAAVRDEIAEMRDALDVPLRSGHTLIIEKRDLWVFTYWRWSAARGSSTTYLYGRGASGKRIAFHRELIAAPDHLLVDHVNGNGLDNRRSNLRYATHRQNMWNRTLNSQVDRTSGFIGVSFHPYSGLWRARMKRENNGERTTYHETAEEAARARDAMVLEARGEFARLNFPDPSRDHIACMQAVLDTLTKLKAAEDERREPSLFPPT